MMARLSLKNLAVSDAKPTARTSPGPLYLGT